MKLIFFVFGVFCWSSAVSSVIEDAIDLQIIAWDAGQPPPKLVATGVNLSLEDAYRVQTGFVDYISAGQDADGFKGGLTGLGDPQRFDLEEPLAGVLPPGSGLKSIDNIFQLDISKYHYAMVEMELGFIFRKKITGGDMSIQEIKDAVLAIFPVLELPDLGFAGNGSLHGKDIIAANASAKHYIVSSQTINKDIEINDLVLKLYHNEELITEGVGSDAMGDQWQALQWLINQRLSSGWSIEPEQILITGAIGKMIPLLLGQYRAEYGNQASIQLDVR